MRRADRLFQIIQTLRRRRRRLATAAELAERLEVSERTIYRDIRELVDSGVPIRGEAGVGYLLDRSYDLPPLMFDEDEIEALVLGARMVRTWGDPALAFAAESALAKIDSGLPGELRERLEAAPLFAVNLSLDDPTGDILGRLRTAIRESRRAVLAYEDAQRRASQRTVRPLALFHWGRTWTLGAWCELRQDFRSFRLDRIAELSPGSIFTAEPGKTLDDLFRHYREESG
ncbi:MAG: YafY family protein [Acidobacteriota bacterium]